MEVRPVYGPEGLVDAEVEVGGQWRHLVGRRGPAVERALVARAGLQPGDLPVFLGAGLGAGVQAALAGGWKAAVVDKETPLLEALGHPRTMDGVVWCTQSSPEGAVECLSRWQLAQGGGRLVPILHPFYARLDPGFYRYLAERLASAQKVDFFARARCQRLVGQIPRILLITSKYFLHGELEAACRRLGWPTLSVHLPSHEIGAQEFVETLLRATVEFRPDFALTINHLGVDREGVLVDLLSRLELPLASWFVDDPHLIVGLYRNTVSPWVVLFTWDRDNVESLQGLGFAHVVYLPLGTDPERFCPRPGSSLCPVAFVGNSMVHKVRTKGTAAIPAQILAQADLVAAGFAQSPIRTVRAYMAAHHPQMQAFVETLPRETQLAWEAMITWQATRDWRHRCVSELLPFGPWIVGDRGWKALLPGRGWKHLPEMSYYADLPHFYPRVDINFNCTSLQMKGAANQRVFDVPACGAFLLTDYRQQLEGLFALGREVVCYGEPGEIPELVRFYLRHAGARHAVAVASRQRVLAQHTYDARLQTLAAWMRRIYSRDSAVPDPQG